MKQFEVGKIYYMRSICDYDCVWRYKIIARTRATITAVEVNCDGHPYPNSQKRYRISNGYYKDVEAVRPLGVYSMAPILTAEKIYKDAFSI